MASTIKIKNSSTAGAVPTSGDLVQGELAINVTDRRIFTENASGTVVELGTPSIDDNGNATAITIDSSENVGIGTSTLNDKFNLYSATSVYQRFQNSTSGTGATDGLQIGNDASAAYIWNYENTQTVFATNNTERMRIDTSGNLLVGTTSANGKITSYSTSDWNLGCVRTGTTTNGHIQFINGNGTVGSITTNGSSTTYVTSSDYRLKENIAPMTGALSVVQQLKPVTYSWRADGSSTQGFIAHELQEVVPECVVGEKDAVDEHGNPKYQGIDTSFLVATLTAAIQELKAIVDAQAVEIAALKGQA